MQKSIGFFTADILCHLYLKRLTFGGGHVIIFLMRESLCRKVSLVEENEMLDYVALANLPRGVAVNASILVGYRLQDPGSFGCNF